MKFCDICGNDIEDHASKCPFCGNAQKKSKSNSVVKTRQLQKINIKIGLPTVSEALRLTKQKMNLARQNHVGVLKIVHGYGSTGKGGKIRIELRKELEKMSNIGIISNIIYGENFTPNACKQLLRRFPDLKDDNDLNKGNKGITLIEL